MQLSKGRCPGPFYIPCQACADFQTERQKVHVSCKACVISEKMHGCHLPSKSLWGKLSWCSGSSVLPRISGQLPEHLMDCHLRCPGTACLEFRYHCKHGYPKGSMLDAPAPSGCLKNSTESQEAQDTRTQTPEAYLHFHKFKCVAHLQTLR